MQVSQCYILYAKKSSNYVLVLLPSPQYLFAIAMNCIHVSRSLLLLSGDIETNPGPDSNAILTELKKLSAGQSQLISEIKGLKSGLDETNNSISELNRRMHAVESHCQHIEDLQRQVETFKTSAAMTTRAISDIEARIDDAENRARRNNLVFFGIPDPSASASAAQAEEEIIRLCADQLNITVHPEAIERAHRLGRHSDNRNRPIIVKFLFYKTKEKILSNGRKLKGTNYSIREDYSRTVQNARKHLLAFARTKSAAFSLRYKTLLIGSAKYMYDETTKSVKEIQ
nr:uncharacterized protein LOC126537679 [Dermacentor andersoni]